MSRFKKSKTSRGFTIVEFTDEYGSACSLQESSSASVDRVWLGVVDPKCLVMARNHPDLAAKRIDCEHCERLNGWVDYPLPDDAIINGRMHINRVQALKIALMLLRFASTGSLGKAVANV